MDTLTGPRAAPGSGTTTSLVILLHGYGADGNDLFGLAGPLGRHLPSTAFRAPNAPERSRVNPMGYQWFPIPRLDGSSEAERDSSFHRSAGLLDRYLTDSMAEEGVTPDRTALVGFSQGTMMSLYVAPRRPEALACIVGFSGRIVDGEALRREARSKPPVLLVHGDQDQMIPVDALTEARGALAEAGFPVRWHVSRGIGHGIAPEGLSLALSFLREHLGINGG
ncbi:MAG TPA: dienelactone hydrolase family protein [Thermohalobaculum sp.]|nr:dienelactone hydrolase family protein [Thermohalobaculum sp.]